MKSTLLLLLLSSAAFAQEAAVASGGEAVGADGSASFSIGQVFYHTTQEAGISVSEGVQQPFEIIPLDVENPDPLFDSVVLYPNPTIHSVFIQLENLSENMDYIGYNVNGQIICEKTKITGITTEIQMENLNAGIYFLNISKDGETVRSFKIIKN